MSGLTRDLAFSARALLRAPLLLVTSVTTLGIGVGLATGVVSHSRRRQRTQRASRAS